MASAFAALARGLFHIGSAKMTRLVVYWDRERALDDLGLDLEPGSSRS